MAFLRLKLPFLGPDTALSACYRHLIRCSISTAHTDPASFHPEVSRDSSQSTTITYVPGTGWAHSIVPAIGGLLVADVGFSLRTANVKYPEPAGLFTAGRQKDVD